MTLTKKIRDKNAIIGVIGLGYVGLPLAVEFALKGFKTIGIDIDKTKINSIQNKKNYISDVDIKAFRSVLNQRMLSVSTEHEQIKFADIIFICVPTPFTDNKDPDISFIIAATKEVSKQLRKDQLIILKSTTFPSTTERYVLPILEESGLKAGKDFHLAFSPERIDPGNKVWNTSNTPIVVGGLTKKCTQIASLISRQIVEKVITVSSPKVAEMEKLLENIFRSVNIALVNELAQLCDRIGGINIWEVINAAATKPFGYMPFYPGPGIGGHCIHIDPYYLSWYARSYDFHTNFIELAAETNESMPFYVREMILREISKLTKSAKDANILILGVSFKKDVDDIRHSPALKIVELLVAEGVNNLIYHDPYVSKISINGNSLKSSALTKERIKKADCVLITTDHSDFDYEFIVKHAKRIIDTRNATKYVSSNRDKIVVIGDGK
jgi:UDP-N-acetyl-D-glucosamine dehydrogenase